MNFFIRNFTRREFFETMALGAAGLSGLQLFKEENLRFLESGDYAQELQRTPSLTEGPFYPDKLPLDLDNDLVIIGQGQQSLGEVTHLHGRVLDSRGEPLKNITVEIWQVDHHGIYLHSGSAKPEGKDRDPNFQGFGRFETASDGAYRFRTIKPASYPGRVPHIHIKLKKGDRDLFTTQCMIAGHPGNERDGVFRSVRDPKLRPLLLAEFKPLPESKVGELKATFDMVIGYTPEDPD